MGKKSRRKGNSGEREVVQELRAAFPGEKVERNIGQSRDGGCDIDFRDFKIEVKRRRTICVHSWMQQASASCAVGKMPVVAMRGDSQEWLICLRLKDVLEIMRKKDKPDDVYDSVVL